MFFVYKRISASAEVSSSSMRSCVSPMISGTEPLVPGIKTDGFIKTLDFCDIITEHDAEMEYTMTNK